MSTASVLIAPDRTETVGPAGARYSLLLSTDPTLVDAAQRLRHRVFSTEPGFALPAGGDGRDADRFDEFCDHLLVREDTSGELVGCYRMLPPPGAIGAGAWRVLSNRHARSAWPSASRSMAARPLAGIGPQARIAP